LDKFVHRLSLAASLSFFDFRKFVKRECGSLYIIRSWLMQRQWSKST
jgi:hypothetical protein